MRWRQGLCDNVALVTLALLALARSGRAVEPRTLNGWHSCSMSVGAVRAECATVAMPLCHGDVCSDNENRTVELFVKRIPAISTTSTRNFWFFPDHPLSMSVDDVERQTILLHQQLLGDVNVYLMDQRGTGRGTRFDCDASQATAATSPLGAIVSPAEVASCADALHTTFGDQFPAAFSLTSAARDVVTFISTFQAKTKVFLYGVGFGTLLVERMMHFPSEEILGFVLDSTATSSGGKKKEFPFRSRSDKDFGVVARAFLERCDDDASCAERLGGVPLENALQKVLDSIDRNDAACAPVASALKASAATTAGEETGTPASYTLRRLLATMLQETSLRAFLSVVIYRLERCSESDVAVITRFISQLRILVNEKRQSLLDASGAGAAMLVYDMIQFSEMWEMPPPSQTELIARFTKTLASDGVAYGELERYCTFTQDTTTACSAFARAVDSTSPSLSYARDSHWNEPSTIKEQASVLFLASRFDGLAPLSYAETLFNALEGDTKQLLVFESAAHNVLVNTPLLTNPAAVEDRSLDTSPSCTRSILASFIDGDGDLGSLDTSCMKQLPANVSLVISEALSMAVLGVTEPYDGRLPPTSDTSSSSSGSRENGVMERPSDSVPQQNISSTTTDSLKASRNRYRTAFIVILVLALLLLGLVALLLYRARKKRLLEDEELQLRKLRGEEEDDMAFLRELYNPSPSEWFNYRSNRMHL